MKQNDINQKFQGFTFKSQLAYSTGSPTPGGPGGGMPPPATFLRSRNKKGKKGNKDKKERV